jgi:RNA polymerase primary sigma factor
MDTDILTDDTSNVLNQISPISRLIQIGRKKSFVTINDILEFFPDAEQDVEQLEEAFAALISAGIPYIEDADLLVDPSDEEIRRVEGRTGGRRRKICR